MNNGFSIFFIQLLLMMLPFPEFKVHAQDQTTSTPLSYNNVSNISIDGLSFTSGSEGASIKLVNCSDIKITNCSFILNADIIGIELENCSNIEVTGCYFESFRTGVYALSCTGGINVHCNSFKNIAGKVPRGQIVQFNKCYGSGNRINYNILDHEVGSGDPEDLINMYGSYGTGTDPIQIVGNQLRGGGPSNSGGGIMIGDDGGHDIRVADNILVDPGQYGIGCPAGSNMVIENNVIYGESKPWSNVGLYVGLQSEVDAGFRCRGNSITVSGNQVKYYNKDGILNPYYNCSCCNGVRLSGNNFDADIDASVLPPVLTLHTSQCGTADISPYRIDSLSLIDAGDGSAIPGYSDLAEGMLINKSNFSASSYNIYAYTSGTIDSLVFTYNLNGEVGLRNEVVQPYALKGDGSEYFRWGMEPGGYFISAKAYVQGGVRSEKTVNFQVTDLAAFPFDGLYLINADTDQPVSGFAPMQEDAVINLNDQETSNFNIDARLVDGVTVGSVVFSFDSSAVYNTDAIAPYAIGGDLQGDFTPWQLEPGPHSITASAYSEANGSGELLGNITINFMVAQSVAGNVLQLENLTLGPNPFKTSFWINFDDLSPKGTIRIYNSLGQMVEERSSVTGKAELGGDLPRGIYVVVLETAGGQRNFQVLKQ